MFRTGLTILLAATALTHAAFAAEAVSARTGEHEGYTRLVFEWPSTTGYDVSQASPGHLKITFQKPAALNAQAVDTGNDTNIRSMRQVSAGDAPLALDLTTPEGVTFRHFAVGGKIVVDIYDPAGKKTEATVADKPAAIPEPAKPPATKKEEPAPVDAEPKKAGGQKPVPKEEPKVAVTPPEPKAAPAVASHVESSHAEPLHAPVPASATAEPEPTPMADQPVKLGSAPASGPGVVTLSSTEKTGAAAFTRGGWLWIVSDRPDATVPPQMKGGGTFEAVDIKGGSAWRMKMPAGRGLNVYGEGGGLIWRVALTPEKRDVHPVAPERIVKEGKAVRAGTIVWPLKGVTAVLDVTDPDAGDTIKVVTVGQADQFAGEPWSFVDMETLNSVIGLAVDPHADDVTVHRLKIGVEAGRPEGLALSPPADINHEALHETPAAQVDQATHSANGGPPMRRLFDFDKWLMGGTQALGQNQTILLGGMKLKNTDERVQDLITLAKMNLANDRGPEALGFLSLASEEMPAILDSPEFIALRGASSAISGKYELAFNDLGMPALGDYSELDYWRAFSLSGLEDWQQAAKVMPADFDILMHYPQPLLEKIGPKLAEIALRGGDTKKAESILAAIGKDKATLGVATLAAIDYLQGQADRQAGKFDEAQKLWTPLLTGPDDLFRVRAGLALTMQELEKGIEKPAEAIDRLEGLRYAWRGDELEAQINFMLGKLYMEQKQYMKAFTILHDAAGMSPDADIAGDINGYMRSEFQDLLMNDKTISPLEAITVYQEFQDLAPAGEDGNKLAQNLAERLVTTDLLGRAGDLLQKQVDFSLQGQEKAEVALRLAAIALLNKDSARASAALDKAEAFYQTVPAGPDKDKKLRDIVLMRARVLSQSGRTEEALSMLTKMGPSPDINRLRADIAWKAGLWPDAADALQDMVMDAEITEGKTLTDQQAALLLNRAVALNLAGDRVELANMSERYGAQMKKTSRDKLFEVVTRPHSVNVMAEQQTIQNIVSEVDMFKDFLKDYKTVTEAGGVGH